jgi:hypothetical protein
LINAFHNDPDPVCRSDGRMTGSGATSSARITALMACLHPEGMSAAGISATRASQDRAFIGAGRCRAHAGRWTVFEKKNRSRQTRITIDRTNVLENKPRHTLNA